MNKLIKEQLDKVKIADLSHFDPENNSYFIPKKTSILFKEEENYIIDIKKDMLKKNQINDNWNNGVIPPFDCCKALIVDSMKNMIKIIGVGYDKEKQQDTNIMWSGWLLTSEIEVVKKL